MNGSKWLRRSAFLLYATAPLVLLSLAYHASDWAFGKAFCSLSPTIALLIVAVSMVLTARLLRALADSWDSEDRLDRVIDGFVEAELHRQRAAGLTPPKETE